MATHGFGCSKHHRSRSREWECKKRSGNLRDGSRMVRIFPVDRGDYWFVGHDIKYTIVGRFGRPRRLRLRRYDSKHETNDN